MPPLVIAHVPAPDRIVVRLTGESDLSTAALLGAELAAAAAHGTRSVLVDVKAVRFWDCSGLHVLADLTADLGRTGRSVRIVGAGRETRRLIAMADFSEALELDGPVRPSSGARLQPAALPADHGWGRPVEISA